MVAVGNVLMCLDGVRSGQLAARLLTACATLATISWRILGYFTAAQSTRIPPPSIVSGGKRLLFDFICNRTVFVDGTSLKGPKSGEKVNLVVK